MIISFSKLQYRRCPSPDVPVLSPSVSCRAQAYGKHQERFQDRQEGAANCSLQQPLREQGTGVLKRNGFANHVSAHCTELQTATK